MRQLLGDLEAEESKHYELAEEMDEKQRASGAREEEDKSERRRFVLQIVQPGLAGLMDGSVSTLAPVFAAAFATKESRDGLFGRHGGVARLRVSAWALPRRCPTTACSAVAGHPWARGTVCGLMTTAGGIGHTMPFFDR